MRKPVRRELGLVLGYGLVMFNDQVGREVLALIQRGLDLVSDRCQCWERDLGCAFKLCREGHQLCPFGFELRVVCGGHVRINGRACSFVRASAVRICTVQYPYGAWAWAACSLPGGVNCAWVAVARHIMNRRAYSFVRASAVRMCTVPVLGLGMAAYSLPGGVYGQNLYWGLCATFLCAYVRYGVRLGQCEQCILYVYVCVYGSRHVQPER